MSGPARKILERRQEQQRVHDDGCRYQEPARQKLIYSESVVFVIVQTFPQRYF